jgi:LppX/LprAFG-like lipoprotein
MRKGLVVVAVAAAAVAAYAGITRAAGSKRTAVSTERVALTVTAYGGSARLDGVVDNTAQRGSFTVDLSNAAGLAPFRIPVTRVDAVVDASRGSLRTYLRVPDILRTFSAGKPWAEVDAGDDLGALTRLATAPSQLLPTLRSVSTGEQILGRETVDGVATTHSRLTVDAQKLAKLAPRGRRAIVGAALAQLGVTQPVDVWVDSSGLLRRATATLDDATVDLRLSDFGANADVRIPSASDTFRIG